MVSMSCVVTPTPEPMLINREPHAFTGETDSSLVHYVPKTSSLLKRHTRYDSTDCRKLRSGTHAQIILNMGQSLAGLYFVFLIGGHVTRLRVLCGFSAAFLQYFMLVFFAWTAVEAVWLYMKLVMVFGTQSAQTLYIVKAGIPAWVIPLLIVVLSAGPGYKYYINNTYCRATRWPFWLGFITPFLLLYVFDWIMFSVITASLLKRRCTRSKATSDSRSKLYRENFIIAVSLATVFGLGWGFGLLVTSYPVDEVTYTFQVLFSIFVGAQGPLLFILHGIRNADARAVWKDWATSFSSSATRLRSMASSSIHKSLTTAQSSVNAPLSSSSTGPHTLPEAGQLFDPQAEAVLSQHTSLEMLSKETMADR